MRFGHLEGMNESRPTKRIYRANVCDGKVGKGRPRESHADCTDWLLKKGQILNTRNRRPCLKSLMDVSEAREICQEIYSLPTRGISMIGIGSRPKNTRGKRWNTSPSNYLLTAQPGHRVDKLPLDDGVEGPTIYGCRKIL
ncbi:hypothetical protein EVAR_19328_1 [Eumeta japonica]|uniref:Uncharacterized protein n=1 Tax=Eumeta variegata TaxID=151549 RepID=A0A4C1TRC7_EUMVA|nr:hypothetical protein EVAR_19328_1 [Eumeta japonica]